MPSPEQVKESRLALGLTQQQAGAIVGATARAWRAWESGFRAMPESKWELFQIKTREMKDGRSDDERRDSRSA